MAGTLEQKQQLPARLLKMAHCVYLATEASVADDIADGLLKAAADLQSQERTIAELRYSLSNMGIRCRHLLQCIDAGELDREDRVLIETTRKALGGPTHV